MILKKNIPLIDQCDKSGFYGNGKFGGNFVAETARKPIEDLSKLFEKLRKNKNFLKKRDYYFKHYLGGETPFFKLENLTNHLGGAQIWCKDVSAINGDAHKAYHATVNALICKESGKKFIAGDTGAGMFGKNLALAAKKMGLTAKIFMGTKDIERQAPNVKFMKAAGAEVVPVDSGSKTLVDAVSECMRHYVSNCDNTHLAVGSAIGANVFMKICAWSTAQISRELKKQLIREFGKVPKLKLINVIGGGSSALGFWNEFIDYDKEQVELIGVEAKFAAPLATNAKVAILHGAAQYCLTDKDGQISDTHSLSAGLDYPGSSPLHGLLKDTKRARYTLASDKEALNAFKLVTKLEKLRPSLEPAHAWSECIRIAPKLKKDDVIVVNNCGKGYKDKKIYIENIGYYPK